MARPWRIAAAAWFRKAAEQGRLAYPVHPVVAVLLEGLQMLIAALAVISQAISAATVQGAAARKLVMGPQPDVISYQPAARAVNNWRREAAGHLGLPLVSAMALMGGFTPATVSRCVRLNNYWCIKKAGWTGEIASDADGHVAFVSAREGAVVAALLLRRYYIDLGRHSARAIVTRWAPAECGVSAGLASSSGLATHSLGRTLRARWLVGHRRGFTGKRRIAHSVVPDRPMPILRAPAIMVGGGESALASTTLAALILPLVPAAVGRTMAAPCPSQDARLSNYAEHAIEGVVASPDADLKLFDADGHPTGNLALVMENMAGVEIGPLKVDPDLVAEAIARARELTENAGHNEAQSPQTP